MQFYSDQSRETDKYSLPDCEVFQLSAIEVAETMEDEIRSAMTQKRFQLAGMNSRVRESMLEWIVKEYDVQSGWFFWFCLPGCMPDSDPIGPYDSPEEAIADCRESWSDSWAD